MSRIKQNSWQPTLRFLKQGTTQVYWDSKEIQVEWSFQTVRKLFPCQLVQCTMRAMGKEVRGFSYNLFLKRSLTIALAEAWERMVFQCYAEEPQSLESVLYTSSGYAAGSTVENALKAAQREYRERYLLYLAGLPDSKLQPFEFRDPLACFLASLLEKKFGNLSSYIFTHPAWGSVLLVWVEKSKGICFDSVFLEALKEKKCSRRILLSLLSANPSEKREGLQNKILSLQDPSLLNTKVLYEGASLPPVAVAFYGDSTKPYLNEWTQDQLFAALFEKQC